MNETDKAWAAGFLDGEGHFFVRVNRSTTRKSGQRIRIGIEAAQSDIRPLEKLQSLFGGSICQIKDYHMWKWMVHGARGAIVVVEAIEPYLLKKRKVAIMVLETAQQMKRGRPQKGEDPVCPQVTNRVFPWLPP